MEDQLPAVVSQSTSNQLMESSPHMLIRIPKDAHPWNFTIFKHHFLLQFKMIDRSRQVILFILALFGVFLSTGIILVILTPDTPPTIHAIALALPSKEIPILQPYSGTFIVTSDEANTIALAQFTRKASDIQGSFTQVKCNHTTSALDQTSVSGKFLSPSTILLTVDASATPTQTTVYSIIATSPDDSSYTFSYIDALGHTRFLRLTRTTSEVFQSNAASFCQQHPSET